MDAVLVGRTLRRRPQPHVVVEFGRRRAVGHQRFLGPIHARQADAHGFDVADASGPHVLAGAAEFLVPPGALLAAGLDDPVVVAGGFDHGPAFVDGQGQRLLDVDVLAGLAGVDCGEGVPVIRQ